MRTHIVLILILCLGISILTLSSPIIADGTPEPTSPALPTKLIDLFKYDASVPLKVKEASKKARGEAIVYDITYQSQDLPVQAYLVVPAQQAEAGPAMLFMHGEGGTRSNFLSEAVEWASAGVTSLLIKDPVRNRPLASFYFDVDRDTKILQQTIIAFRRGLDLLTTDTRAKVDPARLGFVGFSLGAYDGAILAAVEPRLKAAVLSSPVMRTNGTGKDFSDTPYGRAMQMFNLENLVPLVKATMLIQMGKQDNIYGQGDIQTVIDAALPTTQVTLYDGRRALNDNAIQDRKIWLAQQFKIDASSLVQPPTATLASS